jgi:hypothetical protein
MSMDPNWTRWIHASLSEYFSKYFETMNVPFHVEGQDTQNQGTQDSVEFRWDGPYANEVSRKCWQLDIEVNMLVSSILGRTQSHHHKDLVGKAQAAYITDIPVYRYGEGSSDTQSILGCLKLRSDDREAIITSYFGKLEVDIVLEQSTVEAHYRMNLIEEQT